MSEQDRIKDVYNSYKTDKNFHKKWSGNNIGNIYISRERKESMLPLIKKYSISLCDSKLLEIGCAGGGVIKFFLELGAREENIHGIDIRPERVEDAKLAIPNAKFSIMDASNLEYPDNCFDIITTFTLFSSVLDSKIRVAIANEVCRVLKPGGAILYYDFRFNNPSNKNVIGIRKSEIEKLFPKMEKTFRLITLLPPLARRLGKLTPVLYPVLSCTPVLRSHYLGCFVKPSNNNV